MAIPQLNLDDRTFDQLATEGRALIQRYFPAWTDYNPSDPGITLIELFAYLIEAAIYQINRVPERSLERFAELVGVERQAGEPIAQTLSRALTAIQQRYRAITENDFEALALAAPASAAKQGTVVRSTAIARDSGVAPGFFPADQVRTVVIVSSPLALEALGHPVARSKAVVQDVFPADQVVKVVIVPSDPSLTAAQVQNLCDQVFAFLKPRRLVTTKINVVPADHTPVSVAVTVARDPASSLDTVTLAANVAHSVQGFLDDRSGGFDGEGWPFGRSVYRSDLYRLIEGLPGVDHVSELLLNGDQNLGEIPLAPLSLVTAHPPIVSVV